MEEDLQELRHPKARFKKPVDVGIFTFGQAQQAEPRVPHLPEAKRLRPDQDDVATPQASDRPDDNPRSIMPNPSEDITFPGTLKISAEIKNRRMHKNLAHPRPAELKRLLAMNGISDQRIHTAVESMSCDTCNRTKGAIQARSKWRDGRRWSFPIRRQSPDGHLLLQRSDRSKPYDPWGHL